MRKDSYTRYPRPILWLVRGGTIDIRGAEVEVEPFYLGKFPVTNEQLGAFDPGFERSPLSPGDRDPAAGVGFETATAYCEWYAGVSRKPMRLPTEVEWEYACRAGSKARASWGDDPAAADAFAWHRGNSPDTMPRLDARRANDFGLYAMLGGVWEWTISPEGSGVLRGGSVRVPRDDLACTLRRTDRPAPLDDVGFRIAKSFR